MKKTILFLGTIVFISFASCKVYKSYDQEQDFVNYLKKQVPCNYKAIVVIPQTGCGGCITHIEKYFLKNVDDDRILFVLIDIVSRRMLMDRFGDLIHNDNVYILEQSKDSIYSKIVSQYPIIIYLSDWQVNNVEKQMPENDAIGHLREYLRKEKESELIHVPLHKCLKAPNNYAILKNIIIPGRVIQLDTNKVLPGAKRITVDSDYIHAVVSGKIFSFTRNGKLVSEIGEIGKGPKEYLGVVDYLFVHDTCFILTEFGKRTVAYNINGEFLYAFKLDGGALSVSKSMDQKYLLFFNNVNLRAPGSTSGLIDVFSLANHEIVKTIGTLSRSPEKKNNMFISPMVYTLKDKILYNDGFNDTIMKITSSFKCFPYAVISKGKYKPPRKYMEKVEYRDKLYRYFSSLGFWESEKYFFFNFYYKDQLIYSAFDKQTQTFPFCIRIDLVEGNVKGKEMMNEIESFWPGYIYDDKVYSLFEPANISDSELLTGQIDINGNSCIRISEIKQ